MCAVVLLLLFAAGAMLANPARLLVTGERAEGVVVGTGGPGALQVEFATSTGARVRVGGRAHSAWASAREGDAVAVAYNPSHPIDAQLLVFSEFAPAGFVLAFTGIVLLIWISCILVLQDPAYGDPFHLLPAAISRFRLNPFRFPVLFVLSAAILTCGPATYLLFSQALDLRANGIKAVGQIIGSRQEARALGSPRTAGVYPTIAFKDASGTQHVIRGSLVASLSPETGETVEVIYPASHPEKAVLNTWNELYFPPLFFGSLAILFLVLFGLVVNGTIRH
jgi:hypothetical protein